jgi:CheY-like chemotaxis protein
MEALAQEPGSQPAVLVVDDEEVVRRVASLLLECAGYRVVTAADADEALAVAALEAPDVVLLDVMLGGRTCAEVAVGLRELSPELPIVVSSGYDESTVIERVGEIRGSLFIRKPYAANDLVAMVAAALAA